MNRRPNAPKCILGVAMVVLMVMGGWATTTPHFSPVSSAATVRPASPAPPPVDPTTVFELDGNILTNGALDDWQTVNCLGGGSSVVRTGVLADPTGTSVFTTGGSKDDQELTQWRHKDGSVPPKDEIANAYAAKYLSGGETIIVAGAERTETSGSAFIGVWLFKNEIGLNADGTFSGLHAVGDVLFLSEFTNGGAAAQSKVFEWVASGGSDGTHLLDITATGGAGSTFSIANPAPIPAPPCWPYTPNGGVLGGNIPANAFFEGGVNLSAFPALAGQCFSSFLVETRSSFSTTATLKDFVLGSFNTCATCEVSGPNPVCPGSTNLQYTSSGAFIGTHSWSFTDNTSGATFCGATNAATVCVNAGSAGSFTLRDDITGSGGGTSFCTLTVTVSAPPTVTITTASACATSISLTANASGGSGGFTFLWTLPDATTSTANPLVVTAPGNYSVTVTDSAGCTATACNIVGLCLNGACTSSASAASSSASAPAKIKSKKAKPKTKKN